MMIRTVRTVVSKLYVETQTVSGPTEEAIRQQVADSLYVRRRSGLLDADLRTVEPDIQIDVLPEGS